MTARPRDHVVPSDLSALAEVVARLADEYPHVWRACIFGSRVRGDHRSDSDLDVAVQPPPGGISRECLTWWVDARRSEGRVFATLREAVRPIALHLAQGTDDPAHGWVDRAALDPGSIMLRLGKVVCLWVPRDKTL